MIIDLKNPSISNKSLIFEKFKLPYFQIFFLAISPRKSWSTIIWVQVLETSPQKSRNIISDLYNIFKQKNSVNQIKLPGQFSPVLTRDKSVTLVNTSFHE